MADQAGIDAGQSGLRAFRDALVTILEAGQPLLDVNVVWELDGLDRLGWRTITARGRSVVSRVAAHRRQRVGRILARMCPDKQNGLVAALEAFTDAAGEVAQQDLWAIGWTG